MTDAQILKWIVEHSCNIKCSRVDGYCCVGWTDARGIKRETCGFDLRGLIAGANHTHTMLKRLWESQNAQEQEQRELDRAKYAL